MAVLEMNPGPLQEQQELLITEQLLNSLFCSFTPENILYGGGAVTLQCCLVWVEEEHVPTLTT